MFGLLGRKLGHSLSPQIHEKLGDYTYDLFCKEPEELEDFFSDKTLKGYNVTIPYKVEAFRACDELSETAKKIGSVNTCIRRADGTLYGDNTDYFGFSYMAKKTNADFHDKKVLVLGSGGASLTVQIVARDEGAREVVVVSRTGENNYENISRHHDADIIVNTTPVGMYPDNGERLIDLTQFKNCTSVLDLIYNPLKTPLLLDAEEMGINYSNGLVMLVAQAVKSAEQFIEKEIPEENIDEVYNSLLSERKNIVLVGMPGSGKSTIGKMLSEKTDREFLDTDKMIEEKENKKIPEIFAEKGEEYFRNVESECVAEACKKMGVVIATGGGAILRKENRDAMRQNGAVVFLERDISSLATDGRPLSSSEEKLRSMQEIRIPIYKAVSDFRVKTDNNAEITLSEVEKCVF
ncbi:MAG: shikimate kinase [Clostridia bacterium]|nr:shikimate kinase [Clostridia bacterium]